ncbi:hypothetical protein AAG570_001444 [Ranatra chinensis]|uniref:Reverse transcriptase domain-containing protein n=1 Tax=Ranatra chinensis TaxID=642074 RepID=A0ABD0Y8J3_9HEMI
MDVIRQELKDLLDQGIIRKLISPYYSSLWVVPKPPDAQGNLRHRVVVDYKELNKHTRSQKYPLPRLEDMLDRMNGASVFSILDLNGGYIQIRINESDCEKTAFQFERGDYEFTRMPFGLKNAPTTFQRLMDEFLEGLDEGAIQVYMDDIIVFSRSEQEHSERLVQLLGRLKEFGLKVLREKTVFLGDIFGFVVTTDASQVALRAVLSQLDHLGDRPVAFASRKLTSAESRYSAIERELLGVVWAVEYFRPYLWGRQFLIKTDHKPLVWVGGLKEPSA